MTTEETTVKKSHYFGGGISVTAEITTKKHDGWRTIDLEPAGEFRELSLTGNYVTKYGKSSGQIDDAIREDIQAERMAGPPSPGLLRLLDIWERWHMNGTRAGTRAQMEAIRAHLAVDVDCIDAHRGDWYGHICEVLKNTPPFSVICYPDMTDEELADALANKGKRRSKILATRQTFATREEAEKYAATIATGRGAEVVGLYLDRSEGGDAVADVYGHKSGYLYGHAWLIEPLPAEIEAEVLEIMDGKPPRVAPSPGPQQITKQEKESREILAQLPAPPEGAEFSLLKVDTVVLPHPYMVTGKSFKKDSIYLDTEAPCGVPGCGKPASEHQQQKTLFISVKQNRDLNAVTGLHDYLLKIKDQATALGIDGFAFPKK